LTSRWSSRSQFIKSFDFWGWSIVNRPWDLPVAASDRTGLLSAATITVDGVSMTVRDFVMKMSDSPLDWYHTFQQANQLYVTRLYRNNDVPPAGVTPLIGDSRPLYLSSAPLPVAAPDPTSGFLTGLGGNGSNNTEEGYDDAWRTSVVPLPTDALIRFRADVRYWNPPYLEVAGEHLKLTTSALLGSQTTPIPSKALLYQDDNYFWFKDKAWVHRTASCSWCPSRRRSPRRREAARVSP
jgi:hypothetical protein